MSSSHDHILVGHDGDITWVCLETDGESGSFWNRIIPLVRARHLVLDLSRMSGDAGFYVQEILLLASMLQRRETRLWLERVPVSVVRKLGTGRRPIAGTSCLSLNAPYFCTVCENEHSVTLDMTPELLRKSMTSDKLAQKQSCPKCFSAMQFNEIPEAFFSFMDRLEAPLGLGGLRSMAENARGAAVEILEEAKPAPSPQPSVEIPEASALSPSERGEQRRDGALVLDTCLTAGIVIADLLLVWRLF